jgi:hypothetical protein
VAIAVAGAGAFAVAPAQAAPGNCEQWGFSGGGFKGSMQHPSD